MRYGGCGLGKENWCWVEIGRIFVVRDGVLEAVDNRGFSCELGRRKKGCVWHLYSLLKIFKHLVFIGGLLNRDYIFPRAISLGL